MVNKHYISDEQEAELRTEFGYTDKELDMLGEANRMAKAADELRAMAAQDALRRRTGGLMPPQNGDGGSCG